MPKPERHIHVFITYDVVSGKRSIRAPISTACVLNLLALLLQEEIPPDDSYVFPNPQTTFHIQFCFHQTKDDFWFTIGSDTGKESKTIEILDTVRGQLEHQLPSQASRWL